MSDVERRQCAFGACSNEATHLPCCSSHGHPLCCECYCHTHFVETGVCQCQPPAPVSRSLTEALEALEREDPEVAAASASYDRMVDSIIGRGPAPPSDEVRRIYDTPAVSD